MQKNTIISLRIVILSTALILAPFQISKLYSQSEFLDKGTSGLGIAVGSAFDSNFTAGSMKIAYSISGIFDLGIETGISSTKYFSGYTDSQSKIKGKYIAPVVSLNIVKQNETFPLSLFIMGSYQWIRYSGPNIGIYKDDLNTEAEGLMVGAGISSKINRTPKFGIVPGLYVGHLSVNESDFLEFINTIGINVSFFVNSEQGNIFFLSPALSVGDDYTTFGISTGFVL